MKIKAMIASLAIFSASVSASYLPGEVEVKFGGWSHHFGLDAGDSYQYNESHNGLGVEYFLQTNYRSPHRFGVGYWQMKDSFNHDATNTGVIYQYDTMTGYPLLDMVDLNVALYYMERTKRIRDIDTYETLRYEDMNMWVLHPYITIRPTEAFSVDVMYIPSFDDHYHVEALFVRGSLNINAALRGLGY